MSDSENESIQDLLECAEEYENLMREKLKTENKSDENKHNAASSKKKHITISDETQELPMEKVIFGDREGLLENLAVAVGESKKIIDEKEAGGGSEEDDLKDSRKRKPAWTDADDTDITLGEVKRPTRFSGPHNHLRQDKSYKEYLTARYVRTVPQPKWAELDNKKVSEDAEDEALLQTVGFVAKPDTNTLRQTHIEFKRLKDLNRATYAEGSISSIQFIPKSTATLVTGTSGIATIYSIDGVKNEKLHNIRFDKFPIMCARLKPCGTKAIFGSTKRIYYVYDLLSAQEMRYKLPEEVTTLRNFRISPCGRYMAVAGRFGNMHLFDAFSQELIHTFKQNDDVASMCFTADSKNIVCSSLSSKINIFSLTMQRLAHSFIDDGCLKGSAMDLSLDQRLLATGSMEGVVNVYDFQKLQLSTTPKPEKTFLNLRTGISDVKFNHTAEILAMSSVEVESAVKLAHFPSATVFANFPRKDDMGKIRVVEFSPNSAYLALGSTTKKVSLMRLKHYKYY
ncbi:U3 small nucleolar RNA-associated protein 18 homolog [Bactrocera neohumeralis]|uniref:U3 small nucleolar RNA-associated protein 18 homolog n=1 Tax=Bactrocera neohumeralis TaxID=98809 RepID=UPI002165DBDE|nr:U3 small nucleolar RNA-associated protein 18 homolog [Bactrocera neohumeralis]